MVDDAAGLESVVHLARDADRIAVDTESNSMHAYTERVCLVQLTVGDRDFVIDPLAVDISPLGELMATPGIEKIFHAAEYDVICLSRDLDWSFAGLFDTMMAARILGWKNMGLAKILAEHYGVTLDKKYQRHDWGARPLPQAALEYARFDTHYLGQLRDRLAEELEESERTEEARAAFDRLALSRGQPRPFDPEAFWKVKGSRDLSGPQLAVLRRLFALRDEVARDLDKPHFRVAQDSVLAELARRQPSSREALRKIRGLHPKLARRQPDRILDAVAAGLADEAPVRPPPPPRPNDAFERRFETLRTWRKRLAEARGVETDVILLKRVLIPLAEDPPRDLDALESRDLLDAWQLRTYGPQLVEMLAGT